MLSSKKLLSLSLVFSVFHDMSCPLSFNVYIPLFILAQSCRMIIIIKFEVIYFYYPHYIDSCALEVNNFDFDVGLLLFVISAFC